ncbi:hypothetical protein [Candidatus Wolbachia massiliensis]|uniref:Ankyrin repeat domain protein n=1 Tax=Candidatus Wolbachia massiliensis TaxID=1845000 RepID=A0A7L7YMA5_9RICK|nr:hypothetical protein [Candidatus Wolbachia massiliensis]QOD38344.1 hypothetical protein ID128_00165 [Candidatus Wolbachia massiliensis]
MKTSKNANEKDITCKSAYGELTNKDQEKILKLAIKIEEGKGIAEKFKNRILRKSRYNTRKILTTKITYKGKTFTLLDHAKLYENNQAISDILQEAKKQSLSEDILSVKANIKRQILPPTAVTEATINTGTTTVEGENSEKLNITAIEHQDVTPEINNTGAISVDAKSCEDIDKNSKDLDNIEKHLMMYEDGEEALKDSPLTTAVTETVTDKTKGFLSPFTEEKLSFYSEPERKNAVNEEGKSSTKTTRQRQAIIAGSAGAVLLVNSVAFYILKMHAIAVIVGIVGLACIGFALYGLLKPNTKLEKVENAEQLIVQPVLNPK